ncbi:MAG: Crp/Fnr family transcriptional regulator [Gammaproteobacteria bacterium]|nr:Crp/Fnr family transcriptional regulator [Gammaproteobacteria bacterium]
MAIDISFKDAWIGMADCKHCPSRDFSLFASLPDQDLEHTRAPVNKYKFKHGSVIYRADEKGHELYTLRTGLLKLERYLPDGNQRIVRLVRPNDLFGLEVLVKPAYQHDAVVLEDAEICRIPAEVIQRLSDKNPELHKEIMVRWQNALSEADDWLTELLSGSARQRVARLILKLVDDEGNCSLLSREDMGATLSVTTETTSRIIAEFKRQDIIRELRHNYFHCDTDTLRDIAEA